MLFSNDTSKSLSQIRPRRYTASDISADDQITPKPRTNSSDSGSFSSSLIPPGFFRGLALQLPFRRKNATKSNDDWESIELVQFSSQVVVDPGNETGVGHDFDALTLTNPTWCDRCGDFIWGLSKVSIRCKNCSYTCHERCQNLVTLNCKEIIDPLAKSIEADEQPAHNADGHNSIDGLHNFQEPKNENSNTQHEDAIEDPLNRSLEEKLEKFNRLQSQGLRMTMYDDGKTFRGFIRVHMNLCRPINVVAGTRPPSIYDIIYDEEETMRRKTLTSFYLPRDTVKALHITSTTTTREVILALLKKFKVVDNPMKFALYESFNDLENGIQFRRLQDNEQPLMMALMWGTNGIDNRSFVLQENETGDILWDAFSMPELNNFLKILDLEEEEYLNQLKIKYKLMQEQLEELISQNKPDDT